MPSCPTFHFLYVMVSTYFSYIMFTNFHALTLHLGLSAAHIIHTLRKDPSPHICLQCPPSPGIPYSLRLLFPTLTIFYQPLNSTSLSYPQIPDLTVKSFSSELYSVFLNSFITYQIFPKGLPSLEIWDKRRGRDSNSMIWTSLNCLPGLSSLSGLWLPAVYALSRVLGSSGRWSLGGNLSLKSCGGPHDCTQCPRDRVIPISGWKAWRQVLLSLMFVTSQFSLGKCSSFYENWLWFYQVALALWWRAVAPHPYWACGFARRAAVFISAVGVSSPLLGIIGT